MFIDLMKKLSLLILCLSLRLHAYRPAGYLGCYVDWRNRILNGKHRNSRTNSGDQCKHFCSSYGYRYAGTESEDECYCGHAIRIAKLTGGCNHKCSGKRYEICGGHWRINIYDTWHCATNPCRNNAECVDIDADNYHCKCSEEWTGINCEKAKTSTTMLSTTTTTTTSTTVMTSTTVVTEASTGSSISSVSTNKLSTSINRATNTSDFPEIIKDVRDDSMIAMYVLLPFAVIILFVATAILLLRRRRKKDEVPEVIYHGAGSLPNIYANLTISNNSNLGYEYHLTKNMKENTEAEVKEKDNIIYAGQGMEESEYNVRLNNSQGQSTDNDSYDHILMFQTPLNDKTYSQLAAANLDKTHPIIQNTYYSHIDDYSGHYDASEDAEIDDVTYNRLEMKGTSKTGIRTNLNIEDSSEYDHTIVGLAFGQLSEADDYSHINDLTFKTQTTGHDNNVCQLGVKNEIVDEDEYATVVKKPKH